MPADDLMDAPEILTESQQMEANAAIDAPEPEGRTPEDDDKGLELIEDPAEGAEKPEGEEGDEDEAPPEGETPEAKAAREAAKAEEDALSPEEKAQRKLERALDSPIPQDLSKRTSERIQTLIAATREAAEARDAATKDLSTITSALQNSGTTPEQFREFVDFRAGLSSGDPQKQRAAFESLVQMVTSLSDVLGLPIAIKNPVERHADLVQEVQAGKLPLARAEEIARARNQMAAQANQPRQQSFQQPNQGTQQQETSAREALSKFGERMERNDPDYARKRDHLIPILKPIMANLPFTQWEQAFKQAYMSLRLPPVAQNGAGAQNRGTNQPMRHGKRPAGGTMSAPKSLMDAVSAGIAQANGQ